MDKQSKAVDDRLNSKSSRKRAMTTQDSEDESSVDQAESVALSDVSSTSMEETHLVPHQRLTVNNSGALLRAHSTISEHAGLPFVVHQALVAEAPTSVTDFNDDLDRELAFYRQCLAAAYEGRNLLQIAGLPFSRPKDYFAEMVKTDEQMTKVKNKLIDVAAGKRASQEAKKQRELKKMGKQVQVAKQQERSKEKRAMLDKVNSLKRKRKNVGVN